MTPADLEARALRVECVNAHDRCYLGGTCLFCEPVVPLRTNDGKFAAANAHHAAQVAALIEVIE